MHPVDQELPAKSVPAASRSLNVFGAIICALLLAALSVLINNFIKPEVGRGWGRWTNPYTQRDKVQAQLALLKAEYDAVQKNRNELLRKLQDLKIPQLPVSPGPEPSRWGLPPFWDHHLWLKQKDLYEKTNKEIDQKNQQLKELKQALGNLDFTIETKRKVIEPLEDESSRLNARIQDLRLLQKGKQYLSHLWNTYVSVSLHILLAFTLAIMILKLSLRLLLINGWLGTCRIVESK